MKCCSTGSRAVDTPAVPLFPRKRGREVLVPRPSALLRERLVLKLSSLGPAGRPTPLGRCPEEPRSQGTRRSRPVNAQGSGTTSQCFSHSKTNQPTDQLISKKKKAGSSEDRRTDLLPRSSPPRRLEVGATGSPAERRLRTTSSGQGGAARLERSAGRKGVTSQQWSPLAGAPLGVRWCKFVPSHTSSPCPPQCCGGTTAAPPHTGVRGVVVTIWEPLWPLGGFKMSPTSYFPAPLTPVCCMSVKPMVQTPHSRGSHLKRASVDAPAGHQNPGASSAHDSKQPPAWAEEMRTRSGGWTQWRVDTTVGTCGVATRLLPPGGVSDRLG